MSYARARTGMRFTLTMRVSAATRYERHAPRCALLPPMPLPGSRFIVSSLRRLIQRYATRVTPFTMPLFRHAFRFDAADDAACYAAHAAGCLMPRFATPDAVTPRRCFYFHYFSFTDRYFLHYATCCHEDTLRFI